MSSSIRSLSLVLVGALFLIESESSNRTELREVKKGISLSVLLFAAQGQQQRGAPPSLEDFLPHNNFFSLCSLSNNPMLLLRSSRLAALARSRPAFSSKANNRQSVAVAVASPTRKAEECAKEERISKKRPSASPSVLSKQSAQTPSVVASALSRSGGEASSSSSDRASEALAVAAALQPEARGKVEAGEEQQSNKSSSSSSPSEIQAMAARLWSAYDAALTTHPVAVKSATSFVGFLLGDLIAQSIVGLPYDARRTLRLVAFGVFMDGPIGKERERVGKMFLFYLFRPKPALTRARQAHSNKRGRWFASMSSQRDEGGRQQARFEAPATRNLARFYQWALTQKARRSR